jgi:hypothetical protein
MHYVTSDLLVLPVKRPASSALPQQVRHPPSSGINLLKMEIVFPFSGRVGNLYISCGTTRYGHIHIIYNKLWAHVTYKSPIVLAG